MQKYNIKTVKFSFNTFEIMCCQSHFCYYSIYGNTQNPIVAVGGGDETTVLVIWGHVVFYLDASPQQASLVLLFTPMQKLIGQRRYLSFGGIIRPQHSDLDLDQNLELIHL